MKVSEQNIYKLHRQQIYLMNLVYAVTSEQVLSFAVVPNWKNIQDVTDIYNHISMDWKSKRNRGRQAT